MDPERFPACCILVERGYFHAMPSQAITEQWAFMEFRDLFGDGDVSGDLVRQACFCQSCNRTDGCDECASRYACDSESALAGWGGRRIVEIDPEAEGLPREAVRTALLEGADIVLVFAQGVIPSDRILREVAHLVRRLRTAGTTLTIDGLANSMRARIARLEASLGRS